jgi:hypothetical protein
MLQIDTDNKETVLQKHYGFAMYGFRSKLAGLSKMVCLWQTIKNTLAYYEIRPFAVNYESVMFYSNEPYTIKLFWVILNLFYMLGHFIIVH